MSLRPEEYGGNFKPDTDTSGLVDKLQQKINKDNSIKRISNPIDTFEKLQNIKPVGFKGFDISLN